jgi:hypothetical protein
MKKIYFVFLFPILVIAIANTSGPGAGYSGSPLDGDNCTDCHLPGPAFQADNLIVIDVGLNGYIPGQTYPLTVTCDDIVAEKYGFQITSETASAKTGTWIITNASRTQLKSGTAVTHTSGGTIPSGSPNTWSMEWTAPAAGTGPVTFYVAINQTDADNSRFGDMIHVASLTISESGVGIAENLEKFIGAVYPNPATDIIHLNVPSNSEVRVYDNAGRAVISLTTDQAVQEMDVSTLQQGIYFVQIAFDGQYATRSFVKK